MTVYRTLTGDLERHLGELPRGLMAFIDYNVTAPDALVDLDNNKVFPPGPDRVPLNADGTFSIEVIDSGGAGTNIETPGSLRCTFTAQYVDASGNKRTWACRNFAITGDMDLSDAVATTDPPVTVANQYVDLMRELLAQAEEAVGIDTADSAFAYNINHGPLTGAALDGKIAAHGLGFPSPGAGVDCGPMLQAAFDASHVVHLKSNDVYLIETPVFLDSPDNGAKYVLYGNGATIHTSPDLPKPSTWDNGIGTAPPTAFYAGTLRSAWTGGVGGTVTTDHTTGCCNAPMGPRLVIHDTELIADTTPGLVVFGGTATNNINGAAAGLVNVTLANYRAGITWSGYADGNFVEGLDVASNPVDGGTRVIYQRSSGDATRAVRVKAYGGFIADLAGSAGAVIEQPISGQINLVASIAQITAAHQETDEIASGIPWSLNIDRSKVSIHDHYTRASNNPGRYSIRINDAAGPSFIASEVLIKGWRAVANYIAGQGDTNKGPDLYITALGVGGRVRVENSRGLVIRAGQSAGARAIRVASADADIQTALDAGGDHIVTGNWSLSYDEAWQVGAVADAEPRQRRLRTPTLAVAADTYVTGGTLTNAATYEYVAAVKTAAGGYSPLSGVVSVAATSTGAIRLTLTNTTGPVTVALWRKTSAGVAATPDRYAEIGLDANSTVWVDTGANINGVPWQTSALPVPNTVKNTGCQYLFPRVVRKTTNQVVNNSATLQPDNELVCPLRAGGVYRFRAALFYESGTTPDFRAAFDVPTGATLAFGQIGAATAATGNSGSVSYAAGTTDATQAANLGGAGLGTRICAIFEGTVALSTTPGDLQLLWAQAAADASDTTVYAGSFLEVARIA